MRLVSPHRSLMFAGVTGTVDATYEEAWLTDGRANYPVKRTGDLSLALLAVSAQDVDVVAVCHHNLRAAAAIALTGDITNTIPTATVPPNGIPHNWFRILDPEESAVLNVTLGVTSNVDPIFIGEFYAGLSFVPEVGLRHGRTLDAGQVLAMLGERGIQAPYDAGYAPPRGIRGELALTVAEWAELQDIHAAQRDGSRPCLFIKDDSINDAWLCVFNMQEQTTGATNFVTIEILEIPRLRWPA